MQILQFGQNVGACTLVFARGQLQLVKKHFGQLFGRIDIEFLTRQSEYFVTDGVQFAGIAPGKLVQHLSIHAETAFFHIVKHRNKRQLDLTIDF